jgi:hypothetical protein
VTESPFRTPELRPEIVFVFDLMQQLVDGRIRIPQFQRPFVWRPHQMIDLLDSISKQYPIGSLLAWETDEPILSLENVGPIRFASKRGGPAAYLLDGHQRLSTLAGALVGQENRSRSMSDEDALLWNIYFNASDRSFEHLAVGVSPEPFHFPMSKLLDTFEFIQESQRVLQQDAENGRRYVDRIQEIARSFQNYKIPVMQIKQTGLNEAVEIFARLNSRGQRMTADQMVSALLYRDGASAPFNLARAIDDSIGILRSHGFGDIDRTLILRTLLAAIGEDIYRTDWTRWTQSRREGLLQKLHDAIPRVNEGLEAAVAFFLDLGVTTARLLPYGMQMTIVASFFYAQPNPSPPQLKLLRRWFWVTSFATWFGGANPSRVNALVRDVIDNIAQNPESPQFQTVDLDSPAAPLPRSFDMRSARTRVLLLVLFSLQPRDRHGEVIKNVDDLVRIFGPDALGYVASRVDNRELGRSPANRVLRDRADDRGQARNWLLTLPDGLRDLVWESHAIPLDAADELGAVDGSDFVEARLRKLTALEHQFMIARRVTPPLSDAPAAAAADSEVFSEDDEWETRDAASLVA